MHRVYNVEDTICAISTPLGEGGIGIVRLSGPEAFSLVKSLFSCKKSLDKDYPKPRYLYHGYIQKDGSPVDEVLVSFMPAPRTYTCEDVVEINCHSGVIALRSILRMVLEKGARLAEPGEFTKRAFLKGRIDLSQAEAVMNIVKARSEEAAKIAMRTLGGELSGRIESIREEITRIRAPMEACFDYPEEYDENEYIGEEILTQLSALKQSVKELLVGVERNRAHQEGASIAIIGRPNVGKSSLLNALLKQQKAIVHDLPGTTRDMLEGYLTLGGYPLKLIDTAGIQGTEDPVEKEGIERSRAAASMARMLIVVIDSSVPVTQQDREIAKLYQPGQGLVVALNKKDLEPVVQEADIKSLFGSHRVVKTSAISNEGINKLEQAVTEELDNCYGSAGETSLIVSFQHEETLKEVINIVENAIEIAALEPPEMISLELQLAYVKLGEITGQTASDELLDRIFSQFCLGK